MSADGSTKVAREVTYWSDLMLNRSQGDSHLNGRAEKGERGTGLESEVSVTNELMIMQGSSGLEDGCETLSPSDVEQRTIIDNIPVIAWFARSDGSGEFWNRRWHDYTGLSIEEARGWGWTIAIHPDDLNDLEKKWREDLASGRPGSVEGRLHRFDGEYRWFLFCYEPVRDTSDKIVNWYGTNTDIEDLKQAEQKLRESEEEFHKITDLIAQAVAVLSADGTILYMNRVAAKKTGLTLKEVSARCYFSSALHPEEY
jgi:formate hydrogenlyase transcriptional activator